MKCAFRYLFVAALVVGTGCVTAEDARMAEARRTLGLSYLNEGNTEGALKELIDARKLDPRNAKIRHELGLAFFAKDLKTQAETEFLAAIRFDPTLTEARLNLGSLYIAEERYAEAVPYLKQVTEDYLYRSPARAYNNLGWAYYKLGRKDEALAQYQKALKVAPAFCQALFNAGLIYEERADFETALEHYERAMNGCPDDLRFRLRLGVMQARLDRRDDAVKNLEAVTEADPIGALGIEARQVLHGLR